MRFENRADMEAYVVSYLKNTDLYAGPLIIKINCIPTNENDLRYSQELPFQVNNTDDYSSLLKLCNQLKESYATLYYSIQEDRIFKMVGFKHITEKGIAAYWSLMESVGSIGLLWDIENQERIDTLMLGKNFTMSRYATEKYGVEPGSDVFDEIMTELHEELLDARFGLEFAFIMHVYDIICHQGKRHFENLDKLPMSTDWVPVEQTTYFTDLHNEFAKFCAEATLNHTIEATLLLDESNKLYFTIEDAIDFNIFLAVADSLNRHYGTMKVKAQLN